MKKQTINPANFIANEQRANLTHVEKDASGSVTNKQRHFTDVDLWGIRKNFRTAIFRTALTRRVHDIFH